MTEDDRLEEAARDMARRSGRPAWVIARPPDSAGGPPGVPYAALESDTTEDERASPGARRYEP